MVNKIRYQQVDKIGCFLHKLFWKKIENNNINLKTGVFEWLEPRQRILIEVRRGKEKKAKAPF